LAAQIDDDHNGRIYRHFCNNEHMSPEERQGIWLSDPHNAAQEALCDASWDALDKTDPYINELFDTPAKTVAGRQAKLRILKHWLWGDNFKTPLNDANWEIENTRMLLAELCEMEA